MDKLNMLIVAVAQPNCRSYGLLERVLNKHPQSQSEMVTDRQIRCEEEEEDEAKSYKPNDITF